MKERLWLAVWSGFLLGSLMQQETLTHKALVEPFTLWDKGLCIAVFAMTIIIAFMAGMEQKTKKD